MDLPADLVALAEARRRVQIWLVARGVDEARAAEAMRAVGEALSGALEHDDPGTAFGIHLRGRPRRRRTARRRRERHHPHRLSGERPSGEQGAEPLVGGQLHHRGRRPAATRSARRRRARAAAGSRSPALLRKTPRLAEHPVHREVDVGLLGQRLVPGRRGRLLRAPRAARDALDRLHRDVALAAERRVDARRRPRTARRCTITWLYGQEHGVEREALEAAAVHLGDRQSVAGHADEARRGPRRAPRRRPAARRRRSARAPTRPGARGSAAGSDRPGRPPCARASGGSPRAPARTCARPVLVARKKSPRWSAQPGRETQLGVAVARGDVDVVDAVLEQELECRIGLALGDLPERRRPEDHARALVAGCSERRLLDHARRLLRVARPPEDPAPERRRPRLRREPVLAQRQPALGARGEDAFGVCVAPPIGIALGCDQRVLAAGVQVVAAERAAVGRGRAVLSPPHRPPARFVEFRHSWMIADRGSRPSTNNR